MNNISDIEETMNFLMSPVGIKRALGHDEAISHLEKAKNLLENAGFRTHSAMIENIIKRASSINDSEIEVEI